MSALALCERRIKPEATFRLHLTTNLHELEKNLPLSELLFISGCTIWLPRKYWILICKRSRGRLPPQPGRDGARPSSFLIGFDSRERY